MHRHPNIKTQAALDAVADAATLRRYLRDSDHDTHTLVVAYAAGGLAADIARGWVDGGLTLSWPTTPAWPWDAAEKAAELTREAAHDALRTIPALAETDMRTPPVFDCGHTTSFPRWHAGLRRVRLADHRPRLRARIPGLAAMRRPSRSQATRRAARLRPAREGPLVTPLDLAYLVMAGAWLGLVAVVAYLRVHALDQAGIPRP